MDQKILEKFEEALDDLINTPNPGKSFKESRDEIKDYFDSKDNFNLEEFISWFEED